MKWLQTARTVVIDDDPEEAFPLLISLAHLGIGALYFNGDKERFPKSPINGIRIVFLDLRLTGSINVEPERFIPMAIEVLKATVSLESGLTGIICWTKFEEDIETLKKLIPDMLKDFNPSFLLSLKDKSFLKDNVDKLEKQIEKELRSHHAHKILWEWEQAVHEAATGTTNLISEVAGKEDEDLLKILAALVSSSAGNLDLDTSLCENFLFDMLNPIHYDQLEALSKEGYISVPHINELLKKLKEEVKLTDIQKVKLNTAVLISKNVDKKASWQPGNVYMIRPKLKSKCPVTHFKINAKSLIKTMSPNWRKDEIYKRLDNENSKLKKELEDLEKLKSPTNKSKEPESIQSDIESKSKELASKEDEITSACIPVLVEMSPACDYFQKKKPCSRFIGGMLIPEKLIEIFKVNSQDRVYLKQVDPISVFELEGNWHLILNARFLFGIMTEQAKMISQPICRLRSHVLVDIQAWFASHAARPGFLSVR
ncbi:MAG: hypothetical protein AB2L14_11685 [Candidatus Xenobiia bacterium LiM19]